MFKKEIAFKNKVMKKINKEIILDKFIAIINRRPNLFLFIILLLVFIFTMVIIGAIVYAVKKTHHRYIDIYSAKWNKPTVNAEKTQISWVYEIKSTWTRNNFSKLYGDLLTIDFDSDKPFIGWNNYGWKSTFRGSNAIKNEKNHIYNIKVGDSERNKIIGKDSSDINLMLNLHFTKLYTSHKYYCDFIINITISDINCADYSSYNILLFESFFLSKYEIQIK